MAPVLEKALTVPRGARGTQFCLPTLALVFALSASALAADLTFTHKSSKQGELPVPGTSTQQTACLVLDVNRDGRVDFAISSRSKGASFDWFEQEANGKGWTKHPIDKGLNLEAGGTYTDIDGDGDLDIVMGEDFSGTNVYWWENPYPKYEAGTPWKRHLVKQGGGHQHHDQLFGDFDGDGRDELAYWNQQAETLFLAEIPADPKAIEPWPAVAMAKLGRAEGLAKANVNGDGKIDLVGGGHWLEHKSGASYEAHVIDPGPRFSRAAAGDLKEGGRPEAVFVIGDGVGRLKWYEWDGKAWLGHDLLGFDVIHGHTLELADLNADGHLDILCAEMAKWTESAPKPDNPGARMWVFLGDGRGNFEKQEVAHGYGCHEGRVADLDSDGDLDLLVKPYNWETPRLDMWLNQLKGSSAAAKN